jgi:hypothetical protein
LPRAHASDKTSCFPMFFSMPDSTRAWRGAMAARRGGSQWGRRRRPDATVGKKKCSKLLTCKKTLIRFRPSSSTCESEWHIQTRQRATQNGTPPGKPSRWTQVPFPSRKHTSHSEAARSAAGGPGFFMRATWMRTRQVLSISAGASAHRRCFHRIGSRMRWHVAGLFPRRRLELGNTPIDH